MELLRIMLTVCVLLLLIGMAHAEPGMVIHERTTATTAVTTRIIIFSAQGVPKSDGRTTKTTVTETEITRLPRNRGQQRVHRDRPVWGRHPSAAKITGTQIRF